MLIDSLLLSLGASLYLIALLFRDVFWLRVITLLATSLYFLYASQIGLLSMQIWQIIFIAVNGYHIVYLLRQRIPIELPKSLQNIYEASFSDMTPREFLLFWNFGDDVEYQDTHLVEQGGLVESLWLVTLGEVEIKKANQTLASLSQGQFLGEMSFLKETTASADAYAKGSVAARIWSQQKLRDFCALNPDQKHKLYRILARDLSEKISST